VIEALDEATKAGKVRYVGFTGRKHPAIHLKMLSYDHPFDSVQMPLNAFDATYRSFQKLVLPEINKRGIAGLGMKSLGGNGPPITEGVETVEEALRYASSRIADSSFVNGSAVRSALFSPWVRWRRSSCRFARTSAGRGQQLLHTAFRRGHPLIPQSARNAGNRPQEMGQPILIGRNRPVNT